MTDTQTAHQRLLTTISAVLDVPCAVLNDDSSPNDNKSWDSLNHLQLIMALESEFGLQLTADEALEMRSIARIRRILRQHGVNA